MTSEEVRTFREAAQVLLTLLRCISMKRALAADRSDHLNFFRLYDGCLMDVAVISWCKSFGSKKNEQLHWSRLFPETIGELHSRLKDDLGSAAGGDLDALSTAIRNYRDTYVAHHDLDMEKHATAHPQLGPLKETGQVLYRAVYGALTATDCAGGLPTPDAITGENLMAIESQWKVVAGSARHATRELRDA